MAVRRFAPATLLLLVLLAPAAHSAWQSNGNAVCVASGNQGDPAVVHDGSGGAFIVWRDFRGGSQADLYAQHLDVDGNLVAGWPADGRALEFVSSSNESFVAVSDDAGGVIAVWKDGGGGLLAQRVNGAGVPLWAENGAQVVNGAAGRFHAIADGAGGVLVAWDDARGGSEHLDIYAQRLNPAGAPMWTGNGVALCAAIGPQSRPTLTSDGTGGAVVAWIDGRIDLDHKRVTAQRVNAQGIPQWTADGSALGGTVNVSDEMAIASCVDGLGGAYVIWTEDRFGAIRTTLQRVTHSGAIAAGWNADGLPLDAVGTYTASRPLIVSDGTGGCVVTITGQYETWFRRVSSTGSSAWTDYAEFTQFDLADPVLAANGLGGCFFGQIRGLHGSPYTQDAVMVAGLGGAGPTDNGGVVFDAVCHLTGVRTDIFIGATRTNEGIVAWADRRNQMNYDIYATRVTGAGPVAVEPNLRTPLTVAVHPNPVQGALTARFTLERPGAATLAVIDPAGRERLVRDVSTYGPGRHTVGLDGTRALEPGVYFLALRSEGSPIQKIRFAVVR